MKKLVLTTVCALALAGAAFAQGTFNYASISAGAFVVNTNSTTFSPFIGGGTTGGGTIGLTSLGPNDFYFEMLYNTTWNFRQIVSGASAPSNSAATLFGGTWLDTGLSATNSMGNNGSAVPVAGSTQATVPWTSPTTNNIIMVGWSANLGNNWLAVSNEMATGTWVGVLGGAAGYFGVSTAGFEKPGVGNPGVTPFGTSANAGGTPINTTAAGMNLYLVQVIPEPTTMALAGLGGLSLLLFRRRK